MTKIKLLAETAKTVTLRRADFQALLAAAEDNADLAAVERHRAEEERVGWDVAKRNYLTREDAERALDGESLVRIWREKRGMTQRALAEAAQVTVSYLAEIEGGKKPGSRDALQRLAQMLEVPMENLAEKAEPSLQPVTRSEKAAARLAKLTEETGDRDRLAAEARLIVREWLEIAEQSGLRHQVRATVGALIDKLESATTNADALEAAIDALHTEYRKL